MHREIWRWMIVMIRWMLAILMPMDIGFYAADYSIDDRLSTGWMWCKTLIKITMIDLGMREQSCDGFEG